MINVTVPQRWKHGAERWRQYRVPARKVILPALLVLSLNTSRQQPLCVPSIAIALEPEALLGRGRGLTCCHLCLIRGSNCHHSRLGPKQKARGRWKKCSSVLYSRAVEFCGVWNADLEHWRCDLDLLLWLRCAHLDMTQRFDPMVYQLWFFSRFFPPSSGLP